MTCAQGFGIGHGQSAFWNRGVPSHCAGEVSNLLKYRMGKEDFCW